ncbi:MAG TPA: SPFH domain-containing protein [Phycisphaerae bacterium]|nr:SPFH domain-containing protein [Phycisphaerae bacterium]HRY69463.1 SPFH domain-containing protein [Phycisphaerae bacterium]HSA26330.1 SPFH domain-containing protein [Phycisphaerae bacterium]
MNMSLETLSCSDLFAFESSEGARCASLRIHRIVTLTPIGEKDLLHLVNRIQWPTDSPLAETIAAALRERGIPPSPPEEPANNGSGHWHPIPGQGIDGSIDDFDVLLGTEQFIEDAGIPITEPARAALADHDRNHWASILVAAFHHVGASKEIRRSLLGVLAVGHETHPKPPSDVLCTAAQVDAGSTSRRVEKPSPRVTADSPSQNGNQDESVRRTGAPSTLTAEEQSALIRQVSTDTDTAKPLATAAPRPHARCSIRPKLTLRNRRTRQGAILLGLACLSAIAGIAASCLSVNTDEAVIVQRFGHIVSVCGPGLHFRPLWPVETLAWLQPGLIREVRIGSPATDRGPASAISGERVSSLFLTSDAAVRVSGRVEYAVEDVETFVLTVEDPDRLIATAAEAALVENLAGCSVLWALGPERGVLSTRLKDTLQQRLNALATGIRIHGLILDELAPPRGTTSVSITDTFHRLALAEADKAAAIQKALAEKERTIADAKAQAADLVNAAETERTRTVAAATALAQRVQLHLRAFRDNPSEVREQLILNLLIKDASGRPKVLVDPALSSRIQFMVGNSEPANTPGPPSLPAKTQPAATSQPPGGRP